VVKGVLAERDAQIDVEITSEPISAWRDVHDHLV